MLCILHVGECQATPGTHLLVKAQTLYWNCGMEPKCHGTHAKKRANPSKQTSLESKYTAFKKIIYQKPIS